MIASVSGDGVSGADLKKTARNKTAKTQVKLDRLPPNSPESELGVLGCIMLEPQTCLPACIEKFKEEKVFYDLRHQTVFDSMVDLFTDNIPIDPITLHERLRAFGLSEQVGGIAFINSLPDKVPSAANLAYYLDEVVEKSTLRRMVTVCTDIVGKAYDFDGDFETLVDEMERDVLRIAENRNQVGMVSIKQLVDEANAEIERSMMGSGEPTGLLTGFTDFDRMTGGLQPADMIVIAARPSMGKTSLAMNIAENVAVNNGIAVGVFSLEMKNRALTKRMICCRARVNARNVEQGFVSRDRDIPKISSAALAIANAPLYIDDTGGMSILQLRSKARRMAQQYGIKLFVIDYLQLLNAIGGKRKQESRQQEVADISTGVKALAKELDIPIIVLSQLNREMERENRKPRLSDLRESGAIEQDSDVIAFLYKPKSDSGDDEVNVEGDTMPVNLLIAKQRNGPTGDIPLVFVKAFTRFENSVRTGNGNEREARRAPQEPEPEPERQPEIPMEFQQTEVNYNPSDT